MAFLGDDLGDDGNYLVVGKVRVQLLDLKSGADVGLGKMRRKVHGDRCTWGAYG